METLKTYLLKGIEYELYLAASGDYCVSVSEPFEERKDYNLGSKEEALEFILADCEI